MGDAVIHFKNRRILCKTYEGLQAIVNINSTTTTTRIQKGVKQGCLLSLVLLNFYIKKLINVIKFWLLQRGIGVKIVVILIPILRFSDDIVLVFTSERDLKAA